MESEEETGTSMITFIPKNNTGNLGVLDKQLSFAPHIRYYS